MRSPCASRNAFSRWRIGMQGPRPPAPPAALTWEAPRTRLTSASAFSQPAGSFGRQPCAPPPYPARPSAPRSRTGRRPAPQPSPRSPGSAGGSWSRNSIRPRASPPRRRPQAFCDGDVGLVDFVGARARVGRRGPHTTQRRPMQSRRKSSSPISVRGLALVGGSLAQSTTRTPLITSRRPVSPRNPPLAMRLQKRVQPLAHHSCRAGRTACASRACGSRRRSRRGRSIEDLPVLLDDRLVPGDELGGRASFSRSLRNRIWTSRIEPSSIGVAELKMTCPDPTVVHIHGSAEGHVPMVAHFAPSPRLGRSGFTRGLRRVFHRNDRLGDEPVGFSARLSPASAGRCRPERSLVDQRRRCRKLFK